MTRMRSPMAAVLAFVVRAYQLVVSPWLGPRCRFYPSCSAYALDALAVRGAVRGGWLTVCRVARCHPWNPGGIDPVPGSKLERDYRAWTAARADDHPSPPVSISTGA